MTCISNRLYADWSVCATLTIALVLVFAEFTYRLIEVPGIKFGRNLVTQWRLA
jgi:peptidoglycan/LPS O-acetylase OafA/YrhL